MSVLLRRKEVQGVTSFKALYPQLLEEWKYLSNALLVDPDKILPTYSSSVFWECKKCNSTYKASPKSRIQDLQRNKESCNFCKGLRQRYVNY